jgi:hypothetical protein
VALALLGTEGCRQRSRLAPRVAGVAEGDEPVVEGPAVPWARPRPVDPKVVALIDRLTEVAHEGPGTHSTAWASGLIAVDEGLQFAGGVLGSRKPVVAPPMQQLVRLGVAALPDLLNHLPDPRPTRLTVGQGGIITATWHSDEYSPRFVDPGRHPPGVNTIGLGARKTVLRYTVKVGDLCYVAVGQIVNRGLAAIRYQPSGCLVINSPVVTPALAAAARQDWAGLTREQHKHSLTEDAYDTSPGATPAALRRMYFYYPEAAEPLALKFLARPWYDDGKLWDFIMERLVKEKARTMEEADRGLHRRERPASSRDDPGSTVLDLLVYEHRAGRGVR